ncbi:hypothetical protein NA57DRAFT_37705 [Rhizodiscina lignyota]|uniref:F-box domain-containing protein n=1 Tax=Rhizodiscina lignyota TaxID=1504668 RepID=A0A9P4IFS8_9PEZI|nr:hypothetical protein NA57DRAFT_37705 [Rhizodiscina lignyota]
MNQTEAELENFRKRWQEEVSKKKQTTSSTTQRSSNFDSALPAAGPSSSKRTATQPPNATYRPADHGWEDIEPRSYHDLDERETGRRLDGEETEAPREPQSALEHYEKAVEKETQGSLGDSVNLYRKAFRLDHKVHETYKNKHFPHVPKPQNSNPSNAPVTVPSTAHHSLYGLSASMSDLLAEFSQLSIQGEPPPTDLSQPPPCPLSEIPEELLIDILLHTALVDLASFARLAQVCKRLAYLVLTEDRIWKRIVTGHEYGFAAMRYRFGCTIKGKPLGDDGEDGYVLGSSSSDDPMSTPATISIPLTPAYPTYRHLFRQRPRIRFNGCYISTVNYARPGASSPTHITWNSPVLIVTYYRYLRFFRDGSVISLLTTAEPADVVHHLQKDAVHKEYYAPGLPGVCMKDALSGRWRLSGPDPAFVVGDVEAEQEGDLHVETEGVVPKYTYRMQFVFGSAGRGARNNKLNWKGYWSYNKLTDDWAEFGLKNDRAFYWSRVKSYGTGL